MADDYSARASKGQAYNLAIMTAIAEGRVNDNEYITKQFMRHLQFAALLQKADVHQLADVLNSPRVLKLVKDLDQAIVEESKK